MSLASRPDPARRPTVSVVVPTYRRPECLLSCLEGLAAQDSTADEVIVVHRTEDPAAAAAASKAAIPVRIESVDRSGVVFAMAAGAAHAKSEIIAFCDDDAVPRRDWIRRLRLAFGDPTLGAVGGRDVLGPPHPRYPPTAVAGMLGGWGRLTGDHHRVAGEVREVDVLKGVNMAFRASALRFPQGLRGDGAEVHFEVPMCLAARDAGWSVRLDPGLLVDHQGAQRFGLDRRGAPAARAVSDAAFNYTYGLLSVRPALKARRVVSGILVGDVGSPGLVRAGFALVARDRRTVRRLGPSLHGQLAALRALGRGQAISLIEAREFVTG